MSMKKVEKAVKDLNARSLTNEDEIFKFSKAIENWELKFFTLQETSDNATKTNINLWLDELEVTYGAGMTGNN